MTPAESNSLAPNWRIAAVWSGASVLSFFLVLPYLLAIMPNLLPELEKKVPFPLWVLLIIQTAQVAVFLFLMSWAGLRLGPALGLDSPLVRGWMSGTRAPIPWRSLATASALGFGVGMLVLGLDHFIFLSRQPAPIGDVPIHAARWKGFLASFFGGIAEELQVRLFFMTLVTWAGHKIFKQRTPRPWLSWFALVLAAVAFAAGHLPAAAKIWPLTTDVVLRVMVLNSIVGLPLGWLFWRYGLEHAVVAHFCADLALHVVGG